MNCKKNPNIEKNINTSQCTDMTAEWFFIHISCVFHSSKYNHAAHNMCLLGASVVIFKTFVVICGTYMANYSPF